jgi:hypothetical protein
MSTSISVKQQHWRESLEPYLPISPLVEMVMEYIGTGHGWIVVLASYMDRSTQTGTSTVVFDPILSQWRVLSKEQVNGEAIERLAGVTESSILHYPLCSFQREVWVVGRTQCHSAPDPILRFFLDLTALRLVLNDTSNNNASTDASDQKEAVAWTLHGSLTHFPPGGATRYNYLLSDTPERCGTRVLSHPTVMDMHRRTHVSVGRYHHSLGNWQHLQETKWSSYDLVTKQYTNHALPPLPVIVKSLGSCVYRQRLVIAGGQIYPSPVVYGDNPPLKYIQPTHQVWSVALQEDGSSTDKEWNASLFPPLPLAFRVWMFCVEDHMYILERDNTHLPPSPDLSIPLQWIHNRFYRYDEELCCWSLMPSFPYSKSELGTCVLD